MLTAQSFIEVGDLGDYTMVTKRSTRRDSFHYRLVSLPGVSNNQDQIHTSMQVFYDSLEKAKLLENQLMGLSETYHHLHRFKHVILKCALCTCIQG
jgi:hypothetical protein